MTTMSSLSSSQTFPVPPDETARLAALHDYGVLDSLPEQSFDDLTALAAYICGTSIALISLLDSDRQWFKSHHGLDATETPRSQAFCSHAIIKPEEVMVVPNALEDERFADNPLVTEASHVRFYAGAPLVNEAGHALGTLCVIDREPRELTDAQKVALEALGRQVVAQLELLKRTRLLQQQAAITQQKTEELEVTVQQLQQAQTSLISTEKMSTLGYLVKGIAHEINNPVSFISGNLRHLNGYTDDLLTLLDLYQKQTTPEPSPELEELLEEIDLDYLKRDLPNLYQSMGAGTTRIQSIVESLQLFSRLDEKGLKDIDINANLDAVLTLLQVQCGEQKLPIQITKRYGEDLPRIVCDASKINQAFMAIFQNALDTLKWDIENGSHSGDRPQITVTTAAIDSNNIKICISDNGSGILPEAQEKIFEPFFSTKPIGQGTGLGLAICRQIIHQHRGAIACISEQNLGTTFDVVLPVNASRFEGEFVRLP